MPHRRNGRIVMFLFCLFSLISTARPVSAEVTRIEFTSKQPYGTFRAGDYVIWQGKIRGDLSPQEAIPGINKAPRNERGRVDYAAKVILMMPAAPRGEIPERSAWMCSIADPSMRGRPTFSLLP